MTAIVIVGIIFSSILAFFVIVFGFVLALKKIQKGGSIRKGEQLNTDETRLIQEIHQGLSRMEERVEALETILLSREGKEQRREGNK